MSFDPTISQQALPPPTLDSLGPHVATSCFDLLLIELVPLSFRLVTEAAEREVAASVSTQSSRNKRRLKGSVDLGSTTATVTSKDGSTVAVTTGKSGEQSGAKDGAQLLGIGGIGGRAKGMDEEETRERVFWRLDSIGYRVGLGVIEKYVFRPRCSRHD
jgi:hypothetical protein